MLSRNRLSALAPWGIVLIMMTAPLIAGGRSDDPPSRLTREQARILSHLSIVYLDDNHGNEIETIRISGVNFQIVNGAGETETTNGAGNLIIGYSEDETDIEVDDRSGSHNLVIGIDHTFSSYGGLVAGRHNHISGTYASVSGGVGNVASGPDSSVSGGSLNTASGTRSSISGGECNTAIGVFASVSGGSENNATGHYSSIGGGESNLTTGWSSSISGGKGNTAACSELVGSSDPCAATVSGGSNRTADGQNDWAAGSLYEDE